MASFSRDDARAEALKRGLVDDAGALTQKARDTGYYTPEGDPTAKAMGFAHKLGFLRTALGKALQTPLVSQKALNFYAQPSHTPVPAFNPAHAAQGAVTEAGQAVATGAPAMAQSVMAALRNSANLAATNPGEFLGRAMTVFDLGGHLANFLSAPVQTVAEAEMATRDALKARDFSGAADAAAEAIDQAPWIAAEAVPMGKGLSVLAKQAAPHVARLERFIALHDPSSVARGARGLPPLDMSQEARMARARAMGFDVDTPLYHGTRSNFDAFDRAKIRRGPGIWTSTDPHTAMEYSGLRDEGANIRPLYGRGRLVSEQRFYDTRAAGGFDGDVDAAQAAGFAGVQDYSSRIYFNPSNIRSPHAAFDPANSGSSDLLASASPAAIGAGVAAAALTPEDAQAQEAPVLADGSQIVPIDPDISSGQWDRQATRRITLSDGRNAWIAPMIYKGDWIEVIRLDDHGVPGPVLGQRSTLDAYAPEGKGLIDGQLLQPLPRNPADKPSPTPQPSTPTEQEDGDVGSAGVMGALAGALLGRYGGGRILRGPLAETVLTSSGAATGAGIGAAVSPEDDDVAKSILMGSLMGHGVNLVAPRAAKIGGRIEKFLDSGSKSAKAVDEAVFRGPPPLNRSKGDPVRTEFEHKQEAARSAKKHGDPTLWANNIKGKWTPIEAKPKEPELRSWEKAQPMQRVAPAQEIRNGWTLMQRLRQGMAKSGSESVKRAGEKLLGKHFGTEKDAYLAIESEMARNPRFRDKVDKMYPAIALTAGAAGSALTQNNEQAK